MTMITIQSLIYLSHNEKTEVEDSTFFLKLSVITNILKNSKKDNWKYRQWPYIC